MTQYFQQHKSNLNRDKFNAYQFIFLFVSLRISFSMGCVYAERYVCAYSSKAAFLQCNLHTIKCTHLRYTVHCFVCVCILFLYIHSVVQLSPYLIPEHFHQPKKKLYIHQQSRLISASLLTTSNPRQPLIYFVSL